MKCKVLFDIFIIEDNINSGLKKTGENVMTERILIFLFLYLLAFLFVLDPNSCPILNDVKSKIPLEIWTASKLDENHGYR